MGGETPRTATPVLHAPIAHASHSPSSQALFRHSRAPFRHSCAGRNPPHPAPSLALTRFPNSSLPPKSRPSHNPEFRWAATTRPDRDDRPASLDPGVMRRSAKRGEVRWGVERPEPPPPALHAPISDASPSPSSPRPLRHSCAGRNHRTPPTSPNSCYAHTRTGVPYHASLPTTPPTHSQPQPCQR